MNNLNLESTLKSQKYKMPPNLKDSKLHKRLKFNRCILVRFSVLVAKKIVFRVDSVVL